MHCLVLLFFGYFLECFHYTAAAPTDNHEYMPCPMCSEKCQFGFLYGTDGCPNCECAKDPCLSRACPIGTECVVELEGLMYAYGRCKAVVPDPLKPPINELGAEMPCPMCSEPCEYGFIPGTDGCPNCACEKNPCDLVECGEGTECNAIFPPNSFYTFPQCLSREGGLVEYKMMNVSMPCPMCSERCEFGFIHGTDGCPSCECAQNPCKSLECKADMICHPMTPSHSYYTYPVCTDTEVPPQELAHEPEMPCPMCSEPCEYGFILGTDGCPNCECEKNPCDTVNCPENKKCRAVFPEGSLYSFAQCEEFKALSIKVVHNLSLPCPMCSEPCEFGFLHGTDGCPNCECAKDPCMSMKCKPGSTCETVLPDGSFYSYALCTASTAGVEPSEMSEIPNMFENMVARPPPLKIKSPKPCPPCAEACEFGLIPGSDGCPICKCADDPCISFKCSTETMCISDFPLNSYYSYPVCITKKIPDSNSTSQACPMCEKPCEFGFVPSAGECLTCECATDPCEEFICENLQACVVTFTADGLFTFAECLKGSGYDPDEVPKCPECADPCDFGYTEWLGGCPVCDSCQPDPCLTHSCPTDSVCHAIVPKGGVINSEDPAVECIKEPEAVQASAGRLKQALLQIITSLFTFYAVIIQY